MLTDTSSPIHEQRLLALEKGNNTRQVRAALRSGRLSLTDVLTDLPDELAGIPLWELLHRAHKIGVERCVKINRAAVQADINLALPLGRASQRTRQWLIDALNQAPGEPEPPEPPLILEKDPRAEQLAQAIAEHRAAIRGPSPTTEFGAADDLLYHRCARIMAATAGSEAA